MQYKTNSELNAIDDQGNTAHVTMYADGWFTDDGKKVVISISQIAVAEASIELYGENNDFRFKGKLTGIRYDKLYLKTFFDDLTTRWISKVVNEYGDVFIRKGKYWYNEKNKLRGDVTFGFDPGDGAWIMTFNSLGERFPFRSVTSIAYIYHMYSTEQKEFEKRYAKQM